MNVLFLGYWNLNDPLTKATIFPHLQILERFPQIKHIVFANTERQLKNPVFDPGFKPINITYTPLFSKLYRWNLFNKISDFLHFPRQIRKIIIEQNINLIIARGAPAGALIVLANRKLKIPFLVESFEPHAEYMLESGVWGRYDLRYIFQKRWEKAQKKLAAGLMPVADNYARQLIKEGVDRQMIRTVPCLVDESKFYFNESRRHALRSQLGITSDAVVGIYAGKFGGMYLEQEAFALFRAAFSAFANFHLIILSPVECHASIEIHFKEDADIKKRITVTQVPHSDVPAYLSASDFAFATYKPGPQKAFLSPVKVGEYWACGLPVILTEGVGDEHQIIQTNRIAGVLFAPDRINPAYLAEIYTNLKETLSLDLKKEIAKLALRYRSPNQVHYAYDYFLQRFPYVSDH